MSPYILFDSVKIEAGTYPAGHKWTLFQDSSEGSSKRVTDINEAEIVNYLLRRNDSRRLIFKELRLSENAIWRSCVIEPIVNKSYPKPGDIDILICDNNSPNQAIAIECKRIKVKAVSTLDDDVNKIENLKDGISQTKSLLAMGFHQTYLAVIIEVDGRNRSAFNTAHRGLNPDATWDGAEKTMRKIYEFPQKNRYAQEVGFIFIEVIQPTGKSIEEMAGICIRVDRFAKPQPQSGDLTNRVEALMRDTK